MASPSATIEALARRQRASAWADVALVLSAAAFLAVCLHLADRTALQRLQPPEEAALPSTGTRVAALPQAENGVPVIEPVREEPAPNPSNDLQRRIAKIRKGMENAVVGREVEGLAYIPLSAAMSMVDGECCADPQGRYVFGISEHGLACFTAGQAGVDLNGEPLGMAGPARRLGPELYVPAKALVTLYGATLGRDGESGVLSVRVKDKVYPVVSEQTFRIEISRGGRWLKVQYAGQLAKQYPICSGAGGNTPVGHFHIANKAVWPGWKAYWGEHIAGGSSRNPLGARWLGTTARGRETDRSIGIHGTNDPSSIGRRISGGCIRTYNNNAIELYETIPVGTPVWIHE